PEVASYSPTVLPELFETKSSFPKRARPVGLLTPVMKLALITAPVVALYLPMVVPVPWNPPLPTKRLLPEIARPAGLNPVMKLALITAPVVASYSATLPLLGLGLALTHKETVPRDRKAKRVVQPGNEVSVDCCSG